MKLAINDSIMNYFGDFLILFRIVDKVKLIKNYFLVDFKEIIDSQKRPKILRNNKKKLLES